MLRKLLAALTLVTFITLTSSTVQAQATRLRGMTYAAENLNDLQDLRAIGANVVVYQFTIPANVVDAASVVEYRTLLAEKLARLDPLVDLCGQIGLKMLLVLSSPPGGAKSIENPPLHRIFAEKDFQDEMFTTWQTIATRYKDKPGIAAFDLLNEPQQRSVASGLLPWKTLAPALIKTIRAIDPKRFIYIEPPYGNPDYIATKTAKLTGKNVGYNIHAYYPANFRSQGLYGRPINVVYPKGNFNKAKLKSSLSKVIRFQAKTKAIILIGEFAAPRWAPKGGALKYLRDYIDIFESQKWGWVLHAWREADVWSIEHTEDPNNPNVSPTKTSRQILIEKYFKKNK